MSRTIEKGDIEAVNALKHQIEMRQKRLEIIEIKRNGRRPFPFPSLFKYQKGLIENYVSRVEEAVKKSMNSKEEKKVRNALFFLSEAIILAKVQIRTAMETIEKISSLASKAGHLQRNALEALFTICYHTSTWKDSLKKNDVQSTTIYGLLTVAADEQQSSEIREIAINYVASAVESPNLYLKFTSYEQEIWFKRKIIDYLLTLNISANESIRHYANLAIIRLLKNQAINDAFKEALMASVSPDILFS